jgi:hypothetical protein
MEIVVLFIDQGHEAGSIHFVHGAAEATVTGRHKQRINISS